MSATIVPMKNTGALQQSIMGEVIHEDENGVVLVQCERGVVSATRAFSCLVCPELADKVLLAFAAQDAFVIAIVARESKHSRLDFPGDVELVSKKGKLSMSSSEQIAMCSQGSIDQVSRTHQVLTSQLGFQAEDLSIKADRIQSQSQESVISSDDTTITGNNLYQKMEQVVRWVAKVETVNINNWIQNIRNTLSSRSKSAVITAENDMKIDAERIHMG